MMRWVFRFFIGLGLVGALVAVVAYGILRASLPTLNGELSVDGVDALIRIQRDQAGIPTVTADSRADLAYGLGFVHGQDRFFAMDLTRRKAAGELAALVGAAALPLDRETRLHRLRARAAENVAQLPASDRRVLDRYAAGVNAGLADLGTRPPEYWLLRAEPTTWLPEDTVLTVFAMFLELNDERAMRDVRRGYAASVLPDDVFRWLYPDGTRWDAPLEGGVADVVPMPGPDVYDLRDIVAPSVANNADHEGDVPGSNNWAVAGALTSNGRALVADDMHLGLTVPNIFYRARLVQTGRDQRSVSGVTLPGTPAIVAGSNGHVAWAFTNSVGDWSDAIIVRPGSVDGTYRTDAGDRPFDEYDEVIEVARGPNESLAIRETIWGPVLPGVSHPSGQIAARWTAHLPGAVNLRQLDLETARTVREAIETANGMGIPPQNFVVGDADGHIGWTIAGRMPTRAVGDATLPQDWSAGGEWLGWRAPESYPRIVDPENGRIWTANTRVVADTALSKIGNGGYFLGARGAQIRDALFAREQFAPADMLAIQLDDRALFLMRWQSLLVAVLKNDSSGDTERREFLTLVDNWVPRASPDSVGFRLVRAFRLEVRERAFNMLTAPVRAEVGDEVVLRISNQFERPLWQLVSQRPAHLLSAGYADWDAFLLAAVDAVIADFSTRYDGGLAARTWGERNTAAIRHPLSRAVPALADWLDMPQRSAPRCGEHAARARPPRSGRPSASLCHRVTKLAESCTCQQARAGTRCHPFIASVIARG